MEGFTPRDQDSRFDPDLGIDLHSLEGRISHDGGIGIQGDVTRMDCRMGM